MTDDLRIRIKCDNGTAAGVSITDQDGRHLGQVVSVTWSCKGGELAKATIELEAVEVDVVGTVENA